MEHTRSAAGSMCSTAAAQCQIVAAMLPAAACMTARHVRRRHRADCRLVDGLEHCGQCVSALGSLGWCQRSVQPMMDVQHCSSFVCCQYTYYNAAWDGGRAAACLHVLVFGLCCVCIRICIYAHMSSCECVLSACMVEGRKQTCLMTH